MPQLQLLDGLGRHVRGRQRFGGPVDEHVCLLLLFDGYSGHRCRLARDRRFFMQTLLNTEPFGEAYRRGRDRTVEGGLLAFTASVRAPSGQPYRFAPSCTPTGEPEVDRTELERFIDGLSYGSFLNGRSTWMTPGSRSFGLVGVALNDFKGRDAFWHSDPPTFDYFVVTGVARQRMARVLLHELGHAFELWDEYEDPATPCQATGPYVGPNVVYREALEIAPSSTTDALNPANVETGYIPWAHYLSSPLYVVDHPRRSEWIAHLGDPTWHDCTVGNYADAGGPSGQSLPALWEGGDGYSFDVYRAEPYCIMRDESYRVYSPSPPTNVQFERHGAVVTVLAEEMTITGVPTDPSLPAACGPDARDPLEATRFQESVGRSFVPYCIVCRQFIRYRFGIPGMVDPDAWSASHGDIERLGHFQLWLGRHG